MDKNCHGGNSRVVTPPIGKTPEGIQRNKFVQVMRGVCICAVVLTHCLGKDSMGAIFLKPWLYFQVMMFVYISGYLTTKQKVIGKERSFYKKRLSKIIIPYTIWTIVYLLYDGNLTVKYFVKCMITAGACGPLYFLVDYAQIVLLTPLMLRMLDHRNTKILLYAITPVYILLNYWMQINRFSTVVPLCLWLVLPYVLGLESRKYQARAKSLRPVFLAIMCIFLVLLETLEGIYWRNREIIGLMNTQVKITTLIYFIAISMVFLRLQSNVNCDRIGVRLLARIGDFSFGIFCCHKLVIYIVSRWVPLGTVSGLVLWIVTVIISSVVVWCSQRYLPERICVALGFV